MIRVIGCICVFAHAIGIVSTQETGHPPVTPAPPPTATGLNRSLLRFIEDDAPVRNERENHDEALAFDSVVSYAHRVPEESFRTSARRDLTFLHLLGNEAGKYRGEIVEIRGRLARNLDVGPTPALRADGIEHLYEAYITSDQYPGYGWCVFHTEQSPLLPVGSELRTPVVCRGYFFKIYAYRELGKTYRLPLLISRGIDTTVMAPLPASLVDEALLSVPVLIALLTGAAGLVVGMVIWYRIADARTRRLINSARQSQGVTTPADFHDVPEQLG